MVWVLFVTLFVSACGSSEGQALTPGRRVLVPHYQDAMAPAPAVEVVLRPQAFKRDPLYGELFKTLMRLAQARTPTRRATMLEAASGSDEIIVSIGKSAEGPEGTDAVFVLRGVPANLDVGALTDPRGQLLFRVVDGRASVTEYEWVMGDARDEAGVFVLPERTWVIAAGAARKRARLAFASPTNRPTHDSDPRPLAMAQFYASAYRPRRGLPPGTVAVITKDLRLVTLALMPGQGGLVAALEYETGRAAADAYAHIARLAPQLSAADARFRWLAGAAIRHEGQRVAVNIAIPARLLEELPHVTGDDLSL